MSVKVDGLADFQRELRKMDAALPKELRQTNLRIAQKVADKARTRMSGRPGSGRKAAPSIVARAQQRSGAVKIGGARFPFALGNEFGSRRFRQFPPPNRDGYAVFPTIKESRQEIEKDYLDALRQLARRAFPKGR